MTTLVEPNTIYLPCGSSAEWNHDGVGYVCTTCLTYVGSIAQPNECTKAVEKYEVLRRLGSKARWNYSTGEEVILE